MKDNSTTAIPEVQEMHFLANGISGIWSCTDDTTIIDTWFRARPDDVEVIPLCRIPPHQHSHEQRIEKLRTVLARMLHMRHVVLETTHYGEDITDARCIREMYEAPLQTLSTLARYPHREDKVWCMWLLIFWLSSPLSVSSGDARQPTLAVHSQAFHTERTCRDVSHAIRKENVGKFSLRGAYVPDGNTKEGTESS